jgi:hypothetical protein
MRLSLATAACAVSVALLAGCSSSPQGSLPASGPSQTSASRSGGSHFQAPPRTLTREQAKNLHPNVFPEKLLQQLAKRKYHRPVHIATGGSVQEWLMDDGGYIWGLKKDHKVVAYMTDCSGAEGGVVDKSGRLVVACTNTGTVNIYNAGNTTGPADVVLQEDQSGYSYPAAAFEDNSGNIYVTNLYNYTNCDPYCYFSPGNVAYWKTSNQASGAYPSGTYQDPNMYEDYFGDVDTSGNVYLDGLNNSFEPEVDEVSNLINSPSATNLNISLEFPGGVYVISPRGTAELSVIDQGEYGSGQDALYVYSLPYSGNLLYTDKPKQNIENLCDPVAGGYNNAESEILIGDAGCHSADLGVIATNHWKDRANIDFDVPIDGAFIPSDK